MVIAVVVVIAFVAVSLYVLHENLVTVQDAFYPGEKRKDHHPARAKSFINKLKVLLVADVVAAKLSHGPSCSV